MTANKRIKQGVMYVVLILLSIYTLFPIYFLIVNSFKSQKEIVGSPISLPSSFDFSYLKNAAAQIKLGESVVNTLIITVAAVALIVVISSLTAWMMVRNKTKASNFLFLCFTAAMLIPFQSVMYPLVNLMEALGLKNTFGLILMYGGFGLVKPITATVVITNAMWIWNDYLLPFLIIGNNDSKTLTLSLYYAKSLSGQYGNPWELIFPAVLICVIPILIVFIFLQKNIIEGIAAGAVKG